MKKYRFFMVILLVVFVVMGCNSSFDEKVHYNRLIEIIKDIEISINQLFNLNITFDEYRSVFSDQFIDEKAEEKYVRENDFLFTLKENGSSKLINRGQLNEEMLDKLRSIMNPESFSTLRRLNFSKAYDKDEEITIYVKNTYEYPVCKVRCNGKIKADRVLKAFHFVKKNSGWKISSVDEMHQESLCEDELGNFDWVVNTSILHEGEEIKYITSFEKVGDVYVERESCFQELTIDERWEKLSTLEGRDISLGTLLEEVFPEIYHSLSDNDKESSKRIDFCWDTDIPYRIMKQIISDPFIPIYLDIEDICQ